MSRFARTRRVFVVETPVRAPGTRAFLEEQRGPDGLLLCVPHVPTALEAPRVHAALAQLLDGLRARHGIATDVLWAERATDLDHARVLDPALVVWDRRAELDHRHTISPKRVPPVRPDLVIAPAGAALDQRGFDPTVHVLPDAIDVAGLPLPGVAPPADPPDQATVPGPRIALAAPLDPHLDLALLASISRQLPDHFVVALGAPRGIDARTLPCRPNVRWLGEKSTRERARYVGGWDVAIVPQRDRHGLPVLAFEALAAGVPVVASVAREPDPAILEAPLFCAADPAHFARAIELALRAPRADLVAAATRLRPQLGWDAAFARVEAWLAGARRRASRGPVELVLARSSA